MEHFESILLSQENPGYSTRTRKHRRPQLSESEDGDTSASLQPGGGSLNFGRSSHTLPGRGRGQVMLASDWLMRIILTSDWFSGRSRSRRHCGEVRQCAPSQEPVHAAQTRHQGESCNFWLRQELRESQCLSVCSAQTCLNTSAPNLHLFLSSLSQVYLRPL